jgi:hypothetical protein
MKRARAVTSPWLPSLFGGDHQAWFNDPRFDGSFPSRVLPFLYLGNLAHASNAYMLHALGITHVVSVGECALVPPSNMREMMSMGGGGYQGKWPTVLFVSLFYFFGMLTSVHRWRWTSLHTVSVTASPSSRLFVDRRESWAD